MRTKLNTKKRDPNDIVCLDCGEWETTYRIDMTEWQYWFGQWGWDGIWYCPKCGCKWKVDCGQDCPDMSMHKIVEISFWVIIVILLMFLALGMTYSLFIT